MFNISENTKIIGLENTQISKEYLEQAIHDKNLHLPPKFLYFGKRVRRGIIRIITKRNFCIVYFVEENGWAKYLEILEVRYDN